MKLNEFKYVDGVLLDGLKDITKDACKVRQYCVRADKEMTELIDKKLAEINAIKKGQMQVSILNHQLGADGYCLINTKKIIKDKLTKQLIGKTLTHNPNCKSKKEKRKC